MGLVLSLTLAFSSPATAAGKFEPTLPKAANTESQSLTVSSSVVVTPIVRDTYTATSFAELEAIRAAEAQAKADAEAAQARARVASIQKTFAINPPSGPYSGAAVVAYAEQFVGVVPYGMGNNPRDSFSCDGLTQYVFAQFGISLPRLVDNQAARGVRIAPADAQAGDLVVWPNEHIGIYDGHGGIIHSPTFGRMVTHAHGLWGSYYFVRLMG